jgi:hypothetical protein
LICRGCIKDLSLAVKFRNRCRETDNFIKKTTQAVELSIWNGEDTNEGVDVKQELSLDGEKIKDEPSDDIDLFENIDTILEDNLGGSEESSTITGMLGKKKRYSFETSESESEYEERKRRSKSSRKRSLEFQDYEMG